MKVKCRNNQLRKPIFSIILMICWGSTYAQADMQLKGITQAVQNMEEVKTFYEKIFDVRFDSLELQGYKLWHGDFIGMDLLLCPEQLAQNSSRKNRYQFDVVIEDMTGFLRTLKETDYVYSITELEYGKSVTVYDPDGNSMVVLSEK